MQAERNKNVRYNLAVAWFFQINFSKNETPVSYEPRQTEALQLASTERDILLQLNDADLMILEYTTICNAGVAKIQCASDITLH